jgi:hypothetical protein
MVWLLAVDEFVNSLLDYTKSQYSLGKKYVFISRDELETGSIDTKSTESDK